MINFLTGKYQKTIAWFLFFVFYGELAVTLHAGNRMPSFYSLVQNTGLNYSPVNKSIPLNSQAPFTRIEEVENTPASVEIVNQPDNTDEVNIGGPGQPEMNTFKSVGADNMVNLFTGDFSYNIPLLDVGGYPVNIFYNAGIGMDQEASWVGLGWNINPGTISRNMRGLPDDYNGEDSVTKVQSIKPDLTVGVTGASGLETTGLPGLKVGYSAGIFYNNRRGLGLEAGARGEYSAHKSIAGKTTDEKTKKDTVQTLKINAELNLNSQNGMSLDGNFAISKNNYEKNIQYGYGTSLGFNSRQGLYDIRLSGEYYKYKNDEKNKREAILNFDHHTSNLNFARSSFTPYIRMPLKTVNQTYKLKFGNEEKIWFKNGSISGYINETRIDKEDTLQRKPGYGYMHFEKANNNNNALLDFNRLNDGVFTYKTPVISVPVYTYDVFSINGEGTGGSFRGFRGNMGYVRDNYTRVKPVSTTVTLDLGVKNILHGGTELNGVFSPSEVGEWKINNTLRQSAAFNSTDSIYQTFYFKNPGEKAIIDGNYYSKMGADSLIRPHLSNIQSATPTLKSSFQVFNDERKLERTIPVAASDAYRQSRDKRTQVITYLTAEDADRVGLDKKIYSYTENLFRPGSCPDPLMIIKTPISRYNRYDPLFYRKKHHLSEIDVLEADGRRYVYGIPVYQIKQKEVSFTTDITPDASNQLVNYTPGYENSTNNRSGRDGFYQAEIMNGYAHSFLLTGILSPDYVDVTDDGITDDDLGTAIRFNYSRVNKQRHSFLPGNYWNNYKWRMPADAGKANFNEGLKADSRDNKGLYTYGEKELWYLHSIESKNMVATFYVTNRDDGKQAAGENGGIASGNGQKKLDKINLYTKADYLKYGSDAKPVKTVYFRYSYTLCDNFNLNNNGQSENGKLTLDSLWFTYNGNNSQAKNKYRFKYAASANNNDIDVNPAYNPVETDRWGTYKLHSTNPNGMGNNDFPYTLQNSAAKSNAYAAAWNLEKILLPGGAVLKVQYEADDYAYVQDKRACQMTGIAGFGKEKTSTPSNKLYTLNEQWLLTPAKMDHRFVFIQLTQPVFSKAEIREKYLKDFKQLLLKLWVKMPKGNIGNDPAYESLVVYGVIKDYGTTADPNKFYIELEETKRGGSPVMETVLQFLKDNLPSRAYPGYEVNGDGALVQVVRSALGMINSFKQGVLGFEKDLKLEGKCREVQLNRSFARLNNPLFKKMGGGYRIKKITVNDNWDKMTGQFESIYGQEYDYTKTQEVSGQTIVISSGVAAYEPGVGNEENPFREILKYDEKQFLGPTDHSNIELPFAETFFPSPMVGYSKVTVRSIHNKDSKNIKSGIGLQQTEFYTTRDFPVISEFTDFDNDSRHHHRPSVLEKVFNFNKRDFMTLTQGFRIVLNDMNGKMKSQTSYAENDYTTPINYTENIYRLIPVGDSKFKLDNKLPVISGPDGKITEKIVGKDIEVMNDFREHFSETYAANIPLNVEFFTVANFPVIIPTIFRLLFRDKSIYRSATTLKIVNEYGILDSVVNIDKGSVVGTKNLVYDAESGDVLVSRTNNEFKKPVFQFSYPAWWTNTGMEPAYRNIDLTYKGVLFRDGKIEESPHVNMNHFESGDEIFIDYNGSAGPSESLGCIAGNYPAQIPASSAYRIWAVDVRKDLRNTEKQFIFLDRHGNPCNATNATIRIIRSGKRNLTGASVGSIVSLANPVRTVGNQQQIIIDNNTDVINASAAEFKERWRANDLFYAVDTTLTITRQAPVKTLFVLADNSYSLAKYNDGEKRNGHDDQFIHFPASNLLPAPDHFIARLYDKGNRGWPWNSTQGRNDHKSWLQFNFQGLTQNDVIVSASLSLYSHAKISPHNLIYADQYGNHNDGSHDQNNPHYAPSGKNNDFWIERMLGTWPANNSSLWIERFNAASVNGKLVPGTNMGPLFGNSRKDYTGTGSIDVTTLTREMLRDKLDPAKQYATALRIRLVNQGTPDSRICFASESILKSPAPNILIKYYNCSEAYGVGENPPSPPDGQETAECITTETTKFCFSVFSKKQMNPYVEGVLGNWRGFKSYVYYGERRESDPTVTTDIRKDGIIKDYESYWAFNDVQLAKTGSAKWVCNAEITQYNRKGAELENRDPLGRYNAGIYGYQESLPVAVINNSRLRLSAFDGFEDYFYKDDPCEPYCKPAKRHFTTGISTFELNDSNAHSGKYSVKINAGSTRQMSVNISANDDDPNPDIRINSLITAHEGIVSVSPKGIGLKGYYYNDQNFGGSPVFKNPIDEYVNLSFRSDGSGDCKNHDSDDPPPGCRCKNMSAKWKGKIQIVTPGNYEFMCSNIDDEGYVYINYNNTTLTLVATDILGNTDSRLPVNLSAGILYDFEVKYKQTSGNRSRGSILLLWKPPGSTSFSPIPLRHLYPEGKEYLADGSAVTQTLYCEKLDTIQAINHHLIDSFNLVPGTKMVASVWMKKGGQDCKCTAYTNSFAIRDANGGLITSFTPKERIIEGWQQFEAIFTVPSNNAKIILDFQAPADGDAYIDDLRLHPFNANMKSFVYDPVTLRLAAELDENNYASFYEYDDEGGLIRVKKETREGIKTITETRSAVQKRITDF